jgi:hypothetical protein
MEIDPAEVDLDQPSRLLLPELEARAVQVVDTTQILRESFSGDQRPLYGEVDRHFNAHGHEVVADFLEPIISQFLQQSRSSKQSTTLHPIKVR